jgi:hypothetical protein
MGNGYALHVHDIDQRDETRHEGHHVDIHDLANRGQLRNKDVGAVVMHHIDMGYAKPVRIL